MLMTSLVPTLAFSTPAMPPHSAAGQHRGEHRQHETTARIGSDDAPPYRLTAVAAMPPTAIWPSPPTLVRLARCASTKPMPTSASASAAVDRCRHRIGRAPGAVGERRQRLAAPTTPMPTTSAMPTQRGDHHGRERHQDRGAPSVAQRDAESGVRSCRVPCHHRADAFALQRCSARQWPITRPRYSTTMRSATVEQFVEFGRDQQHADAPRGRPRGSARTPLRRRRHRARASVVRRAGTPGPRCVSLARPARPSAGCRRRGRRRPRRGPAARTSKRSISASAASRRSAPAVEQAEAAEIVEPVEHQVFGHAHAGDAAHRVPVLRHDADAGRGQRLRRRASSCRLPRTKKRPSLAGVMPDSTAASSLWPLPSTPATPTISPRLTISVKLLEPRRRRRRRATVRPSICSASSASGEGASAAACGSAPRLAVVVGGAEHRAGAGTQTAEVALDHRAHQAVDLLRRRRRTAPRRGRRAARSRGAPTCLISASLCVTSTTLQPLAAMRRQTSSSAVDLVRQQHRGRLVEHQQPRLAHQALDDLDALALADRQVLDDAHAGRAPGRSRARQARATRSGVVAARLSTPRVWPSIRLSTTVMSGTRLKCWCTIAMPGASASRRPGGLVRSAVEAHLAGVGLVHAEHQVAQRRLAGAVFAQQAVDLAGAMSSETSSSACRLPKRLLSPRSDSSGAAAVAAGVITAGSASACINPRAP